MRRPLFEHPNNMLAEINVGLSVCNKFVGGFVGLLWLAPDHIHIYVESDVDKSVDTISKHVKRTLNESLLGMTVEMKGKGEIWDRAYFAETII